MPFKNRTKEKEYPQTTNSNNNIPSSLFLFRPFRTSGFQQNLGFRTLAPQCPWPRSSSVCIETRRLVHGVTSRTHTLLKACFTWRAFDAAGNTRTSFSRFHQFTRLPSKQIPQKKNVRTILEGRTLQNGSLKCIFAAEL